MLAESVSLSGSEVLVILLVLLALLVATIATAVLGCLWAFRAGRGSPLALVGWLLVAFVEVIAMVPALADLRFGAPSMVGFAPLGALAAQVALYVRGKAARREGP